VNLYYQDAERYIYKISEKVSIEVPFESGLLPTQVVANEFIKLECIDTGTVLITAKKGYSWDGASGAINTESWVVASLVHDCLYQLMREGLLNRSLRKQADLAMYYFLKKSMIRGNYFSRKWGAGRAKASYLAVRVFGAKHTKPRNIKIKKAKIFYNN
tara:strand:- start:54115 stop:54588 length:474 start_codon:yes stop_codon:yes gene_type:complete